jgi:hypothetical protein
VKIETKKETFRDQEFEVIYIDGEKTSITTELGKDWDLWQSIRELYTNGVDEGLLTFEIKENDFQPLNDDTTRILIAATPDLSNLMFNIKDYIADGKEVLHENEHGKIYRKHGGKACIYRKGIRVFETEMESIYDYDVNNLDVGENRLAQYSWDVYGRIWRILYNCKDVDIIRNILYNISADKKFIENKLDDGWGMHEELSDEWGEAINGKNVCPKSLGGYVDDDEKAKTLFLPEKLYTSIVSKKGTDVQPGSFKATGNGEVYKDITLTDLQKEMSKKIRHFLKECKFNIPYEMEIVSFHDKDQYGGVTSETILIDVRCFDKGIDFVINTIIEEYIHIKYNVGDKTRAFQEAAIGELITYMKEINAYNL